MLFHVLNRGVGRMAIFRAEKDYDAFRRGSPYGNTAWIEQTAERLGPRATLRCRGRPRQEQQTV
jgi:hypothetical protein